MTDGVRVLVIGLFAGYRPIMNVTDAFRSMTSIRLALQQLYKQVDDTTTKIGSDAFAVARTIYAATKSPVAGARLAIGSQ